MAKFLQETTVWKDAHGHVLQAQYMNHIYLVNDNNQMIGYIPYNYEEDLDKLRIFGKAMSLYKSRRTFKEREDKETGEKKRVPSYFTVFDFKQVKQRMEAV